MIEIRYLNGEISIDPQRYFDSGSATIGKFRKLVKLSFESDLIYGTNATETWSETVDDLLFQLNCDIDTAKKFNLPPADLKKLESRKRKFEKFKAILSESAVSHAGRR